MVFIKTNIRFWLITFFLVITQQIFSMNEEAKHAQCAHQIIQSYEKKMSSKFDLQSWASGGSFADDVKRLDVYFSCKKILEIDEIRKLEVALVEEFLELINSDPNIRPFLHRYPANAENVGISISFETKKRISATERVNRCTLINGKIYYQGEFDPKIRTYKILHEEPYEEALKIVQNKNS